MERTKREECDLIQQYVDYELPEERLEEVVDFIHGHIMDCLHCHKLVSDFEDRHKTGDLNSYE